MDQPPHAHDLQVHDDGIGQHGVRTQATSTTSDSSDSGSEAPDGSQDLSPIRPTRLNFDNIEVHLDDIYDLSSSLATRLNLDDIPSHDNYDHTEVVHDSDSDSVLIMEDDEVQMLNVVPDSESEAIQSSEYDSEATLFLGE